jgi:hypothetical protein
MRLKSKVYIGQEIKASEFPVGLRNSPSRSKGDLIVMDVLQF